MKVDELQKLSVDIVKKLDNIRDMNHDKDVTIYHLLEEMGELSREMFNEKTGRDKLDKKNLTGEVADVIILLNHLAYLYDIKVEDAIKFKLNDHKKRFNLEV